MIGTNGAGKSTFMDAMDYFVLINFCSMRVVFADMFVYFCLKMIHFTVSLDQI